MPAQAGALKQRLSRLAALSSKDDDLLARVCSRQRTMCRHAELRAQGEDEPGVFFIHAGWGTRFKLLPDGRRQILMFVLPGDIVGLGQLAVEAATDSFVTITEVRLSQAPAATIVELLRQQHGLAVALWRSLAQETEILAEHLASLGRRGALQRTAHLLLELQQRLLAAGEGAATGYDCPLTQHELADALGLTPIHVNRIIRQLREQGVASIEHRRVCIRDPAALAAIAEFDGRFLSTGRA